MNNSQIDLIKRAEALASKTESGSITPEELRTAFRTILSPQRHLIYSIVPKQ